MENNIPERIKIRKKRKKFRIILHIGTFIAIAAISGAVASKVVVKSMLEESKINRFEEENNGLEQMLSKGITNVSHSIVTISDSSDKLKVNTKSKGNVTGIILDKQGHIATSLSNIKDMKSIFVKFPSLAKEPVKADLVGADKKTDVAVIKVNEYEIVPVTIKEEQMKTGKFVFAAGNSISNDFIGMVTVGVVTSTENMIQSDDDKCLYTLIQTNATINYDNIGGALCNIRGELVGFNGAFLSNENDLLCYSLEAKDFKAVVDSIIKFTDKLGISGELIDDKDGGIKGLYVKNVNSDSQAAKWGIRPTDIILSVDDNEVTSLEEINDTIKNKQKGECIECEVLRDGVNERLRFSIG